MCECVCVKRCVTKTAAVANRLEIESQKTIAALTDSSTKLVDAEKVRVSSALEERILDVVIIGYWARESQMSWDELPSMSEALDEVICYLTRDHSSVHVCLHKVYALMRSLVFSCRPQCHFCLTVLSWVFNYSHPPFCILCLNQSSHCCEYCSQLQLENLQKELREERETWRSKHDDLCKISTELKQVDGCTHQWLMS